MLWRRAVVMLYHLAAAGAHEIAAAASQHKGIDVDLTQQP
jgi:hypothetical protein